jgi:hypothetical protein
LFENSLNYQLSTVNYQLISVIFAPQNNEE